VSKLNENEKLVFRNKSVTIQKNTLLTPVVRHIYGDDRFSTIQGINDLLDETDHLVTDCICNQDLNPEDRYTLLYRINTSLTDCINSSKGFNALLSTYAQDSVCTANLECARERSLLLQRKISKTIGVKKTESLEDIDETLEE